MLKKTLLALSLLASGTVCAAEVQVAVAARADLQARWDLAHNPALCAEAQALLAVDGNVDVRHALACGAVNLTTQAALAADADEAVRAGLSSNLTITEDTQEVLVQDASSRVRGALAQNPAITAGIRVLLALDPSPYVRKSLSLNLGCVGPGVRIFLAS